MAAAIFSLFSGSEGLAQDRVILRDGTAREGKILSVNGPNLQLQMGAGTIGLPLANVAQVVMSPPPGVAEAEKAMVSGNYTAALSAAKQVADRFAGLPAEWAKRSALMVAECYIQLEDLPKAEVSLAEFEKKYPGQGSTMADLGAAMIAFAKKDYPTAKSKLEPIAQKALETYRPDDATGRTYGRTFLILGKVAEAEGDYAAALENYLRTVTLFYQDASAVATARERADAIRKEHGTTAP